MGLGQQSLPVLESRSVADVAHHRPALATAGRTVVEFSFSGAPDDCTRFWIVHTDGVVDMCIDPPGYEVDLYVRGPLRAMTAIWMGLSDLAREIDAGTITLDGDKAIARSMHKWFGLSPFAKGERAVA